MRAEELRIGNLVEYGIGREPVSITGHDLFAGVEGRAFKPIPLTEDWLLKFGFIVEDTSTYSPGYEKPYRVYRKLQFTYNGIQQAWWYNGQVLYLQPQHVHQLQNLYFALTGNELTINN